MAKMKSIQADADAALVVAECSAASQQLHEALSELGRIDDELKKAKERASELIAAAQRQLADAGKDQDEAAELLRVHILKYILMSRMHWRLAIQLKVLKRNLKRNKTPSASVNSKIPWV